MALIVCRPSFATPPDWNALWRRLGALDVWTLPTGREIPHEANLVTMDGSVLTVEAFDGRRYRAYEHGLLVAAPSAEATRVEGVRAAVRDALAAPRLTAP